MLNKINVIPQYNIKDVLKRFSKFDKIGIEGIDIKWRVRNETKGTTGYYIQTIEVKKTKSNLGKRKGYYYYFVCPITKQKCRKIYYSIKENLYISKKGFKKIGESLLYPIEALKGRDRLFHQYSIANERYAHYYKLCITNKNARTLYKGKPTKNYLNLLKWNRKLAIIDAQCLEVVKLMFDADIEKYCNLEYKNIVRQQQHFKLNEVVEKIDPFFDADYISLDVDLEEIELI